MKNALVVLSGGQDSATCAAWAVDNFQEVHFISFNYGQKHSRELEAAAKIAKLFDGNHVIFDVPVLMNGKISALTNNDLDMNQKNEKTGLPNSFVPARNLIFLTQAAAYALSLGINDLVTGVCQTDFSGYPDCRRSTIDALEKAIYLGTEDMAKFDGFRIHTPLMYLTKAQTVKLAKELPNGFDAVAKSWTCYNGGDKPCGACPACELRIKGFMEAGEVDPAL